jgi:hypothetical protein
MVRRPFVVVDTWVFRNLGGLGDGVSNSGGAEHQGGSARFAERRRTRRRGTRIPVELRELEVEFAERHGASEPQLAWTAGRLLRSSKTGRRLPPGFGSDRDRTGLERLGGHAMGQVDFESAFRAAQRGSTRFTT